MNTAEYEDLDFDYIAHMECFDIRDYELEEYLVPDDIELLYA